MIADELRSMLRAQPFRPFSIFTADGQEIVVHHHDYAWMLHTGLMVFVEQRDGQVDHISISQITRLNYKPQPESAQQGAAPQG